jgi:hypothetical protein
MPANQYLTFRLLTLIETQFKDSRSNYRNDAKRTGLKQEQDKEALPEDKGSEEWYVASCSPIN